MMVQMVFLLVVVIVRFHGIVVVVKIIDKGRCRFHAGGFFGLQKGRQSVLLWPRGVTAMMATAAAAISFVHSRVVKGTRMEEVERWLEILRCRRCEY